jgi:hypothetical protein
MRDGTVKQKLERGVSAKNILTQQYDKTTGFRLFPAKSGEPVDPKYIPPKRRCEACGAVLSRSNEGYLCRPCLGGQRAEIEIDPIWLMLIENADDVSIELVADIITGRKKIGDDW